MSGQGPKRGLLLGKVAFQFTSECLQLIQVGFDILWQHVFEPLSHSFGQNGGFAVGADREFQRTVCDDATHVEIAPVGHVGHVQQVPHQPSKSDGPLDFSRLDGGHDADVVSADLPWPRSPSRDCPDIGVFVNQLMDRLAERGCKHSNPGMRTAFEKEMQLFLGDFRASEDVEGEAFGLQEDGELGIHE